jgi:hypothetical protein
LLFDRVASIDIGEPGGEGFRVTGLRLAFDVLKTSDEAANTADVTIYNLAPAQRGRVKEENNVIVVRAGYAQDAGEKLLFSGDITRVIHANSGPDIQTRIEAGDGQTALREARSSFSFVAGASGRAILQRLAQDLGVPIRSIPAFNDTAFRNGFSFSGLTRDGLNRVCSRLGLEWSIQNGELVFILRRRAYSDEAVLITAATGLLRTPEPLQTIGKNLKGDAENPGWQVETLLNTRFEPGGAVRIESRDIVGNYVIRQVRHQGDTRGGDWKSILEVIEP